jgi:hypothetical protein
LSGTNPHGVTAYPINYFGFKSCFFGQGLKNPTDLAERSGVGSATIKRMESINGVPSGHVKTLLALKRALEEAGVEFLGWPGTAPGVCLVGKSEDVANKDGV